MAEQKVYVSVDYLEYKQGKQDLLSCQVDLLRSLKNLQEIRKIRAEKNKLKLKLARQLSKILKDVESLRGELPQPKLPKNIHHQELDDDLDLNDEDRSLKKSREVKNRSVEQELLEIQRKINQLNRV